MSYNCHREVSEIFHRKAKPMPKYGMRYKRYIIDLAGDGAYTVSPLFCDGTLAIPGAKSVEDAKAAIDRLDEYRIRSIEDIMAAWNMKSR